MPPTELKIAQTLIEAKLDRLSEVVEEKHSHLEQRLEMKFKSIDERFDRMSDSVAELKFDVGNRQVDDLRLTRVEKDVSKRRDVLAAFLVSLVSGGGVALVIFLVRQ